MGAETLVLAELSIDAQGVVTGVAVTKDALEQVVRKTEQMGQQVKKGSEPLDLIAHRMFNLRHAAIALVGSFSLAGVIFQVSALAKELITGTDAWKDFASSMEHAWLSLTKGETALQGIARELDKTFKGAAGAGPTAFLAKIDEIQTAMEGLTSAEQKAADQGTVWTGAWKLLTGQKLGPMSGAQQDALLEILQAGWAQLGKNVDATAELMAKQLDMTKDHALELIQVFKQIRLPEKPAPTRAELSAFLGLPSAEDIDKFSSLIVPAMNQMLADFRSGSISAAMFSKGLDQVVKSALDVGHTRTALVLAHDGLETLRKRLGPHGADVALLKGEYERLKKMLIEAGISATETAAALGDAKKAFRLGEGLSPALPPAKETFEVPESLAVPSGGASGWGVAADGIKETDTSMNDFFTSDMRRHQEIQDMLDTTIQKYQQYGDAVAAAYELVGAAAASGLLSQSAAAKAAMILLAAQATIRGMFELAEASAAAARHEYHAALLHKIAAGLYFATAAFHGAAAFGGGGGGGSSRGGSFGDNQASSSRQAPVINITVEGSMIGSNPNQLARELRLLIVRNGGTA